MSNPAKKPTRWGFAKELKDDPAWHLARAIAADTPRDRFFSSKVRTLKDMDKKEIKALEKLYGCAVLTRRGRQGGRRWR